GRVKVHGHRLVDAREHVEPRGRRVAGRVLPHVAAAAPQLNGLAQRHGHHRVHGQRDEQRDQHETRDGGRVLSQILETLDDAIQFDCASAPTFTRGSTMAYTMSSRNTVMASKYA